MCTSWEMQLHVGSTYTRTTWVKGCSVRIRGVSGCYISYDIDFQQKSYQASKYFFNRDKACYELYYFSVFLSCHICWFLGCLWVISFYYFPKIAIWITYYLITTNRCGYLKVTVNYHHRGEYTLAVAVHAVLTVFVLFSLDFGSLFLSLMQLSIIFFLLKISQPLWLQVFGTHKQSPGVYSVNVWRRRHTCVRGLLFFPRVSGRKKFPLLSLSVNGRAVLSLFAFKTSKVRLFSSSLAWERNATPSPPHFSFIK